MKGAMLNSRTRLSTNIKKGANTQKNRHYFVLFSFVLRQAAFRKLNSAFLPKRGLALIEEQTT